jgi:hypothetical protein
VLDLYEMESVIGASAAVYVGAIKRLTYRLRPRLLLNRDESDRAGCHNFVGEMSLETGLEKGLLRQTGGFCGAFAASTACANLGPWDVPLFISAGRCWWPGRHCAIGLTQQKGGGKHRAVSV